LNEEKKVGIMENQFKELGVIDPIIEAILAMGFINPTEVQAETIPCVLEGKDLIVMSKTGSGKTGAFGIPILQMINPEGTSPQALILTPTRELAVQVDGDIKRMAIKLGAKTMAVYGQHSIETEISELKNGAAIISGTPGRVADHIKRKTFDTKQIKFLVLDEADRMLDMGFIDQVVDIIKHLPKDRITLLFSATMPSEIKRICQAYMKQPWTIELEADTMTVDAIKQIYYKVAKDEKRTQLARILQHEQPDSCMIFCNTRMEVDRIQNYLVRKGYHAEALHGANTQSLRTRTIEKFKKAEIQILVATDVAARGLHIEELSLVINYDIPDERNSYVHRIGRTGRAGNSGKAINIVTSDDIRSLYDIEEHVGVLIDEEKLPTDEEINAVLATAEGKWTKVAPPKHVQKMTHDRKAPVTDRNKQKPGHTHKPVAPKSPVAHKPVAPKSPVAHKPVAPKSPVAHKPVAPKSSVAHETIAPKSSVAPKSPVAHKAVAPKASSVPKAPEHKTTTMMTKMGPVKVIVKDEPAKPKLIDKIKGIFGKVQ
jgi:ATP-dependent RNA helicase DeaD